jgi:signal transduction histidine kinase
VKGKDEIARLASSFNRTAEKIQALVLQERRMLASASHELRSPLARVRMAIELLETAEPERRERLVAEASRDIEELDLLVEDLLSSVRAQTGLSNSKPLDLSALVEQVAARFDVVVDGSPVNVEGDRRMLERLTRNLLENALRHGGGAAVRVSVESAEGTARIVVEDEGPGVPEAERERIFEPFYRPSGHDESTHGGVGLGLSLVRQIASHHGGRAWVEPRPGGGSRFIAEIAIAAPAARPRMG